MIEIRHKTTGRLIYRTQAATLATANLRRCRVAGADLRGADLRDVDLHRTDLAGADLEGASLAQVCSSRSPDELRSLSESGCGLMILAPFLGFLVAIVFVLSLWLGKSFDGFALLILMLLSIPLLSGWKLYAGRGPLFSTGSGWTVRLCGANLRKADLTGADLQLADLQGADLREATLDGANIGSANLGGITAENARMAGIQGAGIGPKTSLRSANLRRADLQRAFLPSADLSEADLSFANLAAAQLSFADLSGANLASANLAGADLRSADLRGADLRGADLRAELAGIMLRGARYDESTRWPAGFDPVGRGCVTPADIVPAAAPTGRGDEAISTDPESGRMGGPR